MKKLLTLLAISIPVLASAQKLSDSLWASKNIHHQVGINATAFIKQFLSFNSSLPQADPFSVTYKLFNSNAAGTKLVGGRIGLGFTEITQSGTPNPNFERSVRQTTTASKLGLEMQQKIAERWTLMYGVDMVYISENLKVTTKSMNNGMQFTTVNNESTTNIGGGPFLGLQFNINKRLSLSTETAFYYLDGTNKSTTTTDFPQGGTPEDRKTKNKSISFISPANINFNIMF